MMDVMQNGVKIYRIKGVEFAMVFVPGGEFLMGSPPYDEEADLDEMPQHRVKLSPFWIGVTEVTQALWKAVMGYNPSYFHGDDQRPVEMVSWLDCQAFIQRLNRLIPGSRFRLPTEAEWEYACRAGSFSGWGSGVESSRLYEFAWHFDNSEGHTHPVKQKNPNAWGLHDMHGNVWEWCADAYSSEFYKESSAENPMNDSGIYRIVRGGSWDYEPFALRCTYRGWFAPDARLGPYDATGLRLAHD
jgi:formylglycine-generating enzyme required for sulfatase activity